MTPTHKLLVSHNSFSQGTLCELRASRQEDDRVKFPSGWSVLIRVADRQKGRFGDWPEFVLDSKQIGRI